VYSIAIANTEPGLARFVPIRGKTLTMDFSTFASLCDKVTSYVPVLLYYIFYDIAYSFYPPPVMVDRCCRGRLPHLYVLRAIDMPLHKLVHADACEIVHTLTYAGGCNHVLHLDLRS